MFSYCLASSKPTRQIIDFNQNWKFKLNDTLIVGWQVKLDDSQWRKLDFASWLDIESDFLETAPATPGGGALPGGLGWVPKIFYAG